MLFSAALSLGERERGVDVPHTFQQLIVGTSQKTQPRDPGCVAARTSRPVRAGLDLTERSTQYALSLGLFLTDFKRVSSRSLGEPDENFSIKLTGDRGAALATRHPTYNEDSQLDLTFRKYTKRHYKSWVKFARDKGYGEDLRLVLVSGFDMTKDFAMVAYSKNRTSGQAGASISTPMLGGSASAWGTWFTECSPYTKHGPQECGPPSGINFLSVVKRKKKKGKAVPSSQSGAEETPTAEFNQCVFIRYYTMQFMLRLFPKVIRAGAGPHDLGSGENRGNTFPELAVRSDAEPMSGDEDSVRFFPCPFVSALTVALRVKNMTVGAPSRTTCSR